MTTPYAQDPPAGVMDSTPGFSYSLGSAGVSMLTLSVAALFCVLAVVLIVVFATTRKPANKRADDSPSDSLWSISLSTPALLVPAVAAGLFACVTINVDGWGQWFSENPFGLRRLDNSDVNTWLLLMTSAMVAGYVGLLTAFHHGTRPGSGHFLAGIQDHTLTFLLAKLIICGWASFLSSGIGVREPAFAVAYLGPSLLLAPVLGTAAQHPRRPILAIKAAVDRTWDMATTSRLLLFQTLILVGLWYLLIECTSSTGAPFLPREFAHTVMTDPTRPHTWSIAHEIGPPPLTWLAADASSLSFNAFPFMPLSGVSHDAEKILLGGLFTAVAMFVSAVFMHAHFRRVMQRPTRVMQRPTS